MGGASVVTPTTHDIGLKAFLDAFYLLGNRPKVSLFATLITPLQDCRQEARALSDWFRTELVHRGVFQVHDRDEIRRQYDSLGNVDESCITIDCAVQIGKALDSQISHF